MNMDDQLRELLTDARTEQSVAGLQSTARLLWAYYAELKAQGFSENQAFGLVTEYHYQMCSSAFAQLTIRRIDE
jgi:hypothetical protein